MSYFAVFDGHGGYQCAQFLRDNLHGCLVKSFLATKRENKTNKVAPLIDQGNMMEAEDLAESLAECIKEAFAKADSDY